MTVTCNHAQAEEAPGRASSARPLFIHSPTHPLSIHLVYVSSIIHPPHTHTRIQYIRIIRPACPALRHPTPTVHCPGQPGTQRRAGGGPRLAKRGRFALQLAQSLVNHFGCVASTTALLSSLVSTPSPSCLCTRDAPHKLCWPILVVAAFVPHPVTQQRLHRCSFTHIT